MRFELIRDEQMFIFKGELFVKISAILAEPLARRVEDGTWQFTQNYDVRSFPHDVEVEPMKC